MCPSSVFVPHRLREPTCPRLCPAVGAVAHASQIIVAPATHDAGSVPAVHDSVLAVVTRPQLAAPADTARNRVGAGEVERERRAEDFQEGGVAGGVRDGVGHTASFGRSRGRRRASPVDGEPRVAVHPSCAGAGRPTPGGSLSTRASGFWSTRIRCTLQARRHELSFATPTLGVPGWLEAFSSRVERSPWIRTTT